MRSNEVFTHMSPEEAGAFLAEMKEEAPPVARMALTAAANAFKLRPEFLKRQPKARQAEWVRKALARRVAAVAAEEILATYYMDHQNDLLCELLDGFGIEHEEGALADSNPKAPTKAKLKTAVEKFRKGAGEGPSRELLLRAFAAQTAVDWPDLEALLDIAS